MRAYRFTIDEGDLEMILGALGMVIEANADEEDTKLARALLVRLDSEADEQFLQREYPQHAG